MGVAAHLRRLARRTKERGALPLLPQRQLEKRPADLQLQAEQQQQRNTQRRQLASPQVPGAAKEPTAQRSQRIDFSTLPQRSTLVAASELKPTPETTASREEAIRRGARPFPPSRTVAESHLASSRSFPQPSPQLPALLPWTQTTRGRSE